MYDEQSTSRWDVPRAAGCAVVSSVSSLQRGRGIEAAVVEGHRTASAALEGNIWMAYATRCDSR